MTEGPRTATVSVSAMLTAVAPSPFRAGIAARSRRQPGGVAPGSETSPGSGTAPPPAAARFPGAVLLPGGFPSPARPRRGPESLPGHRGARS